jgi:hypothetical protein
MKLTQEGFGFRWGSVEGYCDTVLNLLSSIKGGEFFD